MSAIIPVWAIGKHLTSLLLTPQTVSTLGVLSDTTPTIQFFANLQDVQVNVATTMENISAMDRPFENNVPIEQKVTLSLTEYEKSAGSNLSAAVAFGATYWKWALIRGGQTFGPMYGIFADYSMDATKPKITANLKLEMIDTGTVVPTYG